MAFLEFISCIKKTFWDGIGITQQFNNMDPFDLELEALECGFYNILKDQQYNDNSSNTVITRCGKRDIIENYKSFVKVINTIHEAFLKKDDSFDLPYYVTNVVVLETNSHEPTDYIPEKNLNCIQRDYSHYD